MREVECHAETAPVREGARAPAGLLAHQFEHAAHARCVEGVALHRRYRGRQQVEPELQRILARRVRQLVDERLHRERNAVASRRTQRTRGHAVCEGGRLEQVVGDEAPRELADAHVGLHRDAVAPGHHLAARVHRTLEKMKASRTIVAVSHVVLTRPQELHRRPGFARDPRRLHHVVVLQAPAEAAADARQVDGDVLRRDAHRPAHQFATGLRHLRRRPDLELAVLEMSRAVLRLKRGVRNERIEVLGLHHLGGRGERGVQVAVLAHHTVGGLR